MKAPFPWFGGKSQVADLVWSKFGEVQNYVEPFFGSGAVLLGRPPCHGIETINDKDCFVANFWRALQNDPDGVTTYADQPVNEADLSARHLWLVNNTEFTEKMKTDPMYFDVRVAGWWVWGLSCWIGSGWCAGISSWGRPFADGALAHERLPHLSAGRGVHRKRPHLGDAGMGVHRKLPHLGDAGMGVHRQLPHLGNAGEGVHRKLPHIGNYMQALADRLRYVRVCCGDWKRICGPTPTTKQGLTGIFLDPPYSGEANRTDCIYATDSLTVAHDVREWAIAHGDDSLMRIALCGYEGEYVMPDSWECVSWKAHGGYGSQGQESAGRANAHRERIWFSPHCLSYPLFQKEFSR